MFAFVFPVFNLFFRLKIILGIDNDVNECKNCSQNYRSIFVDQRLIDATMISFSDHFHEFKMTFVNESKWSNKNSLKILYVLRLVFFSCKTFSVDMLSQLNANSQVTDLNYLFSTV